MIGPDGEPASRPPQTIRARVGHAPVAVEELAAFVGSPRAGAVATFAGVVRDHHAGKQVSYLEYEAYEPMARRVLLDVLEQASRRWRLEGIAADHRLGRLEVGDVAVAIAVSAAHRDEALDALRFVIDTLKQCVPIWKRETGPDGTFWIEGPSRLPAES